MEQHHHHHREWPVAWHNEAYVCKCFKQAAQDFTQHASLHGLRYISDKSISRVERWFWLVSCLVTTLLAVHFIQNLFLEWVTSPVMMTLSPHTIDLRDIPFPAVTVCNANQVRSSVALDILSRANASGQRSFVERKLLHDYCNLPQEPGDDEINEAEIQWSEVQEFLFKVSQRCSEMVVACFWHGEMFDCGKLFMPTLTQEGYCCAFNVVKKEFLFNHAGWSGLNHTSPFDSLDWTMEGGYPRDTPPYTLPWRPWGMGSHMGLRVVLDAQLDEYFCSSDVSMGFKVAVHNPKETPKMTSFASTVQPGQETRMVVEPMIWTTKREALQDVPVAKRNCLFHDEKSLAFYRTYTQRNCMLECETNFTLQACGCVFFHNARVETIKVCGRNESKCALKALNAMEMRLVDDGDTFAQLSSENSTKACGCKPGCFAITYKTRLSTVKLLDKASFIPPELMGGHDPAYFRKNMAIINVYFTDAQFPSIYRTLLHTYTDVLANTGGLLGLFMGFSFLSAVEAFYFLTLRLWCFLIRNRHVLQRHHVDHVHAAAAIATKAATAIATTAATATRTPDNVQVLQHHVGTTTTATTSATVAAVGTVATTDSATVAAVGTVATTSATVAAVGTVGTTSATMAAVGPVATTSATVADVGTVATTSATVVALGPIATTDA